MDLEISPSLDLDAATETLAPGVDVVGCTLDVRGGPGRVARRTAVRTIACECRECGAPFQAARRTAAFCGVDCKTTWNNRRKSRGADLYDLIMTMRYDRSHATAEGVDWTLVSNIARAFRDADKARRAGRQSWDSDAAARLPVTYSTAGDGR